MKKILVPTDFSNAAKNALEYAIGIAKTFQSEIILLNAYSMPHSGSTVMIDVSDVLKGDSVQKLKEEVDRTKDIIDGVSIHTASYNGATANTIANVANNEKVDLIIMGTTGATGLKEVFMGSNTADLIKQTAIPIIAVPNGCQNKSLSNVAMSVDLHHIKSPEVFAPLKKLLSDSNSTLTMINISDNMKSVDPVSFVDEAVDIDNMFFGIKHTFKFLEGADVEEEILAFINKESIDLLTVVSRKRNFFERLFHKSMSKKLTMHSPIPILILSEE